MSCRDDDDYLYDSGGSLHDGVKNVRGSVNDDGFSHSDDENEGSDEEGNNMTVSDGDSEIRSIRIGDDGDGRMGNGDEKSTDQSDDDGNPDHKILGKCF